MNSYRSPNTASIALGLAAFVSFVTAICAMWLDRTATAVVAASFTIIIVLLHQIPIIDSFEIFTLKAKFVKRIDEFDRLMDYIKESARVSSNLLYVQLAFMNRMGSVSWARKRTLLSEIDGLLGSLGVAELKIAEMKIPFLNMISLDLFRIFEQCLRKILFAMEQEIDRDTARRQSAGPISASDQEYHRLIEAKKAVQYQFFEWSDMLSDQRLQDIRPIAEGQLQKYPLKDYENVALSAILEEVVKLAEECWVAGNITVGAENYLEKYSSRPETRLKEIEAAAG